MGTTPEDGAASTDSERLVGPRVRLLLGGLLLLAILVFVWYRLDWRSVLEVLEDASVPPLVVGGVTALLGLACWSEAVRGLLPPGGETVTRRRGFLVYATGALVRNVLPLGYASSIAILAYVYRREASISFDRSLAAVSVAEFTNVAASTTVAVVGAVLLVAFGPPSPLLRWLAGGVLLVVAGGTLATTALWYRRDLVTRALHAVAAALSAVAGRLTDRRNVRGPLSPDAVESAIARYYRSLSTVSARRHSVGAAYGYSLLAWGGLVASLYLSGLAIGYRVPVPVAMLVVAVGGYATILPIPGGLGGYELGVTGAIALLAGVDVVTALATTLLFRLCTYWFVVGVGVVASAALSVDVRGLAARALGTGRADSGSADR